MKRLVTALSLTVLLSACSYTNGEAQLVAARDAAAPAPAPTMASAVPARASALYAPAEIDRRRDRPLRGF